MNVQDLNKIISKLDYGWFQKLETRYQSHLSVWKLAKAVYETKKEYNETYRHPGTQPSLVEYCWENNLKFGVHHEICGKTVTWELFQYLDSEIEGWGDPDAIAMVINEMYTTLALLLDRHKKSVKDDTYKKDYNGRVWKTNYGWRHDLNPKTILQGNDVGIIIDLIERELIEIKE
jgi:hypothetical protein